MGIVAGGGFTCRGGCRPLSSLAGGGIVLRSLKLGASLFPAPSSRLGSGTRGHALAGPAGPGLVLVAAMGEPRSRGLCAGVAMGRGPCLLAAGCEQLGAATPFSVGMEELLPPCLLSSCTARPWGTTLMGMGMEDQPLLGMQRAPKCLHVRVAMAAGGSILPACGVGGCPEPPFPPGALARCRRSSGFLCCHQGVGTSPVSRPRLAPMQGSCPRDAGLRGSALLRAPWERDRSPSVTHTTAWGRCVSLFPSRLQPVPTGALQFGEVVRIVGKIQMPQSGYK